MLSQRSRFTARSAGSGAGSSPSPARTTTAAAPAPRTPAATARARRTRRLTASADLERLLALRLVAPDVGRHPPERRILAEVEGLAGLPRAGRIPERGVRSRLRAVHRVADHRRLVDPLERGFDRLG